MNIEVDLEVNADVALSAFVEVERKGYADNVFAQLAKLYSGEKLLHWAMILTSRQGDHTAGNIDTPEDQAETVPAEPVDADTGSAPRKKKKN